MNLKDYWTQPPQTQNKMIAASQPKPSYLRPKGCKCKVADARECYVQKHRERGERVYSRITCDCACHYETRVYD